MIMYILMVLISFDLQLTAVFRWKGKILVTPQGVHVGPKIFSHQKKKKGKEYSVVKKK